MHFFYCLALGFGMDGKSATSIFKVADWLKKKRVFWWFATVLVLLPTFLTHLFFWQIEHRLKLKIHGKPLGALFPGTINLSGSFLEWQGRFRVRSGFLTIHYPPVAMFQSKFPLVLEGRDLVVEAGSDMQRTLGRGEITFDRVAAKLIIGSKHADIEFLDAESKTIQFHLKSASQSGNLSGNGMNHAK